MQRIFICLPPTVGGLHPIVNDVQIPARWIFTNLGHLSVCDIVVYKVPEDEISHARNMLAYMYGVGKQKTFIDWSVLEEYMMNTLGFVKLYIITEPLMFDRQGNDRRNDVNLPNNWSSGFFTDLDDFRSIMVYKGSEDNIHEMFIAIHDIYDGNFDIIEIYDSRIRKDREKIKKIVDEYDE